MHNIWNGITIFKINKNYVDIYWFTGITVNKNWREFFLANKLLLLEFINYFNRNNNNLYITNIPEVKHLFKFTKGLDLTIPPKQELFTKKLKSIKEFMSFLNNSYQIENNGTILNLLVAILYT